jgi:hypothetical protein
MAHRPRAGRLKKVAVAYFFALHKKPTEFAADLSFRPALTDTDQTLRFDLSL